MTQADMVLEHLNNKGVISPIEAYNNYGIMRLGARIYDLRNSGYEISSESVSGKNRYGASVRYVQYRLVKED